MGVIVYISHNLFLWRKEQVKTLLNFSLNVALEIQVIYIITNIT